jgi:exopolyphosphatase/guanosine-5'-triphosphate,3'-diphosphate pyrophosphatase
MMQILEREKKSVRLDSGGNDMKYLQEDAMQRGTTAIMNFSKIAKSFNAEIRAVATSAVREAINKDEFINRVNDETGVEIEVVSGIEEGRLVYIGCILP